jgi:NitT/TauT family transport system permease protein
VVPTATSVTSVADTVEPVPRVSRRRVGRRSAAKLVHAVVAVILVIALWLVIKHALPLNGVSIGGTRVLPRTDNASLPSPLSVLTVLGQPNVALPGEPSVGVTILKAAWVSLRLTVGGFAAGLVIGTFFGLLMSRFGFARRACTPFLIVVPTIPILAIAPLVAAWSGTVSIFGTQWQSWMSVLMITAYLSTPAVAIGLVRGLASPSAQAVELLYCSAATPRDVLLRLRLPAAVPYLIPAMKISAAGAVVATIVSEISTGTNGGLGRLILDYASEVSFDGSRLYAAVIAAAMLGMFATGLVSLLDNALRKFQPEGAAR